MSDTESSEETETEKMDPHIKSQLTFVLFCICSFVMLIIYIAVDEQLESSRAIAVSNTHALDLSGDRLSIDRKNIPPKCLPVNHIAFLPMLESNSPFIKSLFIHYGLKHHLSFALPTNSGTFFNGLGHPFTPAIANLTKVIGYNVEGFTYDILCHDMILDAAKVYEIMPEDTKFIGLLSNPIGHFKRLWGKYESLWSMKSGLKNDTLNSFQNSSHLISSNETMRTFLNDPWKYLQQPLDQYREAELLKNRKILQNTTKFTNYQHSISSLIHTRNPQLFTYGFEVVQKNLVDVLIQSMISSVEAQYHIILIDEYFDLSLALLKHKLCWAYKDIITVAAAVRRPLMLPTHDDTHMDSDIIEKLKIFNKADFDFYDTMNQTFWETIHNIGLTRVAGIKDTIVGQAENLQRKCIERWETSPNGYDTVPILKDESKHLQECQRIELIRKNVIKTLQTRQKQLVIAHKNVGMR